MRSLRLTHVEISEICHFYLVHTAAFTVCIPVRTAARTVAGHQIEFAESSELAVESDEEVFIMLVVLLDKREGLLHAQELQTRLLDFVRSR